MPELPEVEAVVRTLRDEGLRGLRLKTAQILRPRVTQPQAPEHVEALTTGVTVTAVRRRAKNILIDLSNSHTLRIHLGMSGDVSVQPASYIASTYLRAEWSLAHRRKLIFTDPRVLGRVHVYETSRLAEQMEKLGPEPLGRAFTKENFRAIARASRLPAKLFLMDQTKIAGLGNIYAAEALFRAGISPLVAISSLNPVRLERLRAGILETLRTAVHSVYKAYRNPGGYRQHQDDFNRYVYGRKNEPCVRCGRPIQKIEQGGRSTYFCARCQR